MTGYQEILTDPSYAGQIITFTFPHIGNVGANEEDSETPHRKQPAAQGAIFHAPPTAPSNWRASQSLNAWLEQQNLIALSGVDTRALTHRIRRKGMLKAALAHGMTLSPQALVEKARNAPDMEGQDLTPSATGATPATWTQALWHPQEGYQHASSPRRDVVVVDYGIKSNILRLLCQVGCRPTIVPAQTPAQEILALKPQGIVLSNGPGDPAATAITAVPIIRRLLQANIPLFGICLGHQLLALALGAQTKKMPQGHHGANHPVKNLHSGSVDIVSMNHGFCVCKLPPNVQATHISLFDGTNCGLRLTTAPVFSVQYHPEASPGPMDSHPLFQTFLNMINAHS